MFNLTIIEAPDFEIDEKVFDKMSFFHDNKTLFLKDYVLITESNLIKAEIGRLGVPYESLIPCVKVLNINKIEIQTNHLKMFFEGLISKVLNNNDNNQTHLNKSETFRLPSNLNFIKYIMIYTDIIEAQYFGDVRSSILRTVNLSIKNNKESSKFFDNPQYLNVNKTRFDTINIEICDISGNHIKYKDLFSNVLITLHFRLKK